MNPKKRAKIFNGRPSLQNCYSDVLLSICSFMIPLPSSDFDFFLYELQTVSTVIRRVCKTLKANFPLYRVLRMSLESSFLPLVSSPYLVRVRACSHDEREFMLALDHMTTESRRISALSNLHSINERGLRAFDVEVQDLQYIGIHIKGYGYTVSKRDVVYAAMCCHAPPPGSKALEFFHVPPHCVEKAQRKREKGDKIENVRRLKEEVKQITGWPSSYFSRCVAFKTHQHSEEPARKWFTLEVSLAIAREMAEVIINKEFQQDMNELDQWDEKKRKWKPIMAFEIVPVPGTMTKPTSWVSRELFLLSLNVLGLGVDGNKKFAGEASCKLWRGSSEHKKISEHLLGWKRKQQQHFVALLGRHKWNLGAAEVAEARAHWMLSIWNQEIQEEGGPPLFFGCVNRLATSIMTHMRGFAGTGVNLQMLASQWNDRALLKAMRFNAPSGYIDILHAFKCSCPKQVFSALCISEVKCARCCRNKHACWRHFKNL